MTDSLYLPVFESNFLGDNEELLSLLNSGQATLPQVSAMCSNFRRAAIASLLQTGRSRMFRERLQRSGSAFAHYLAQADEQDKRISESLPVVDAIGAGDLVTATEIARSSHHHWVKDEEYEEDFLFFEFIMQHALLNATEEDMIALLDRWEACLAGTDDRRLDVCRALLQADPDAFAEALPAYLEERHQSYAEQADLMPPEERATEAQVSVEGLALIRLARTKGIPVQSSYPQIPEPACDDQPIAWSRDSFNECS